MYTTQLKRFCVLLILSLPAHADFAIEDADETGVSNPSDFSWRHYQETIKRFPARLGITCYAAYILDKTNSHEDTLMFLNECANRGNVSAMIYLSAFYENGTRVPIDLEKSSYWLKRGAETNDEAGYSDLAAYHYGLALLKGRGVEKNTLAARAYFQRAADAGVEAAVLELKAIAPLEPTNNRPRE